MKIGKFLYKRKEKWGVIEDDIVHLLKKPPFPSIKISKQRIALKKTMVLTPAAPSKIILVGLNYKDHAKELGMKIPKVPIIFLKPPTTLLPHKHDIRYPKEAKQLDYEAELALVIKKKGKNIPERKVSSYILGYTCCNDITARDLQKKDRQWTRAKSFDTFCPLGPCLKTDINPDNLHIRSYVNGKIKQSSFTSNLIFSVSYLVSFISKVMTLLPGDVISTGTPPGVGELQPGDKVKVEIEGIGSLENKIRK